MIGYRIYEEGQWGENPNKVTYTTNYDKAVQLFNDLVRRTFTESKDVLVDREDFSEEVANLKEEIKLFNSNVEVVSRSYPYILTRDLTDNTLCARLYVWEQVSYEYTEYDIQTIALVLKEINFIE